MRISGGDKGKHYHRWNPLDKNIDTDKVCECGAVRTWNSKKWVVVHGKKVLKQDMKREKFECVLCGCEVKGITVHDFKFNASRTEVDWQLCPNHAIIWMMRRLQPDQVKKIRELAGCDTFATHGDFYDEAGNSVQPVGRYG